MYYRIARLCTGLSVSRSSYYAWGKRPKSNRAREDKLLLQQISDIHEKSGKVYGSKKLQEY